MARALDALPRDVLNPGCQLSTVEELGMDLSPAVSDAVGRAAERLEALVRTFRRDGRFVTASDDGAVRPVGDLLP